MGLLGDFANQFTGGGDPMGSFMRFAMNNRGKYKGQGQGQPESQPMGGNMMQMGGMMGRRPKMMGGGIYNMPQMQPMQPMQGQDNPYAGLQQPRPGMLGVPNIMGMWRR